MYSDRQHKILHVKLNLLKNYINIYMNTFLNNMTFASYEKKNVKQRKKCLHLNRFES